MEHLHFGDHFNVEQNVPTSQITMDKLARCEIGHASGNVLEDPEQQASIRRRRRRCPEPVVQRPIMAQLENQHVPECGSDYLNMQGWLGSKTSGAKKE